MTANGNRKLGDLFRNRRERGLPGLPVMSVTLNDGLVGRDTLDRKTDTNLNTEEHLLIKAGDIAYNMMRMWQGASGLAKHDGIVSPAYIVLAPKNGIDPVFASYWFKSSRIVYLFWAYSYGLTNDRLRLYFKDFAEIPVLVPPQDEQVRIGEILSLWDTVIAQTEKLIEAKRKLKKGLMQQLLTGKQRFPGFKDKWQMMSVKDLCTYIGSGGTPSTSVPEYWSGTIPWITGADFTDRGIGVVRRYITDEAVQSSATRVCPKESILLVSRTGVGKIALAPFNVAISQDITVLELTSNLADPLFILFALDMSLPQLQRFNQGTSINGVMRKDLVCHQILVPSLQEQKKIAIILLAMDSEIDLLTSCVEQLKEQKRGLMQKLLTGQVRVKATKEITA
jgi:type I restriction enzyme S subunit